VPEASDSLSGIAYVQKLIKGRIDHLQKRRDWYRGRQLWLQIATVTISASITTLSGWQIADSNIKFQE
jgi:hypothetical protein